MSALEHDSALSTEYVHSDKVVRPEPTLMLGGATLKWYDIAPDEEPVQLAVRALARRNLRDAAKSGALSLAEDELGFVVLHRCGGSFYFLLVCTWRNENELWETVWAKPDTQAVSFRPWPREESHVPTFCVWELAAVCHERTAWSDYLRSARDDESRRAYLRSSYEGLT